MNNRIPDVILESTLAMRQALFEMEAAGFEDTSFVPGLSKYLESVESAARLHHAGRFMIYRLVVRLLKNRLRVQRDLKETPAIRKTPVVSPLFILGLPRTGTTLLHRLLACDPAARHIRLSEGLFPSPPPHRTSWAQDQRVIWSRQLVESLNQLGPQLAVAHALDPLGPEECSFLLEHTFADLFFEVRTHVPEYSQWLRENENDPRIYREFRQLVQHLGFRWPGKHWVFKAPRHLICLSGLLHEFPDARIVWTHRNPIEVVPSMCSLSKHYRGVFSPDVDEQSLGEFWFRRLSEGVTGAMENRQADQPQRYVDVRYEELVSDPIGIVRRIYDAHGLEFTTEFESAMQQQLQSRTERIQKHEYSCEQFGLEPTQVGAVFRDYSDRFLSE